MNKRWCAVVVLASLFAVAASAGQRPNELKSVMRDKLAQSQKILEAVVTSDWASLESHSRELEQLTNDPRWMALKYPEYSNHSTAFIRSIQDLHNAAVQRDLERTPQAYVAMTLKCVECHRYLARVRVAR
jgi:hypothetical protein